ncbi:Retrovirus-related Pol polyprotein from transposon RE2 [Vitis vinifera]|uniref:Retrovirus-related Pol polyprotein from transposon RE2 n=1 Tax=Vitis vinifera TaxID=29760 RepID=A0A438JJ37_VITVI|nr:Retrovirus-related Pol polyprotein from transposon RE2 [Vitis vinifera]
MATSSSDSFLIAINATQQITARLTPTNFPSWHAQFESLLLGYKLFGYVDGTHTCPLLPTSTDAAATTAHHLWFRQDKLILSAILTSVFPVVIPLITTSQTSYQAWTKLTKLYASRSRTRVMQLKEDLTLMQRGNRSITEYLHSVKTIVDKFALIDAPLSQDDITLYVLHGLGSDFRDIVAPIRARESSLSFEELHDLLLGYEAYLRRLDSTAQSLVVTANTTQRRDSHSSKNQSSSTYQQSKNDSRSKSRQSKQYKYPPRCQYCDQQGHIAKYCPKLKPSEATVNCTTTTSSPDKRWLIDSAASHNITSQVSNLQFHSEYDGTDEVIIRDGSGLPITHSGSLTLSFPNRKFQVEDTLCVPTINKNLISVHHFTKQNNVILEFHPTYFLVKDRRTGEILLQGPCENGVYHLPSSPAATPIAFVHECTSVAGWHQPLGHPSFKVVTRLISSFSLPTTSCLSGSNNCHSCSINKAHQLPFHKHGLTSTTPFDLLYTDVWGPSPTPSQTFLSHASLPSEYWAYAFATATYLINRLPSPVLHHKSPLQAFFKQQPRELPAITRAQGDIPSASSTPSEDPALV